ncbi:Hypothetical predicted protein [Olea europaea subsp. europaea]|uniref:Avr9/Cf-9 rapidly elicited protein 146 n=1 Tax=Olea europaea subsp. europaea TaxID=158383 RepID=A0A8S0S1H5_OLEEU|nr:Hypothetical predicted protein [Olea europaea subsp. europaea]
MEQNLPIIAKKIWNIMRVMFFMLRKGISKGKLLADLNVMMKRGKIAGKAIQNLMFHQWSAASGRRPHNRNLSFPVSVTEYEFSCSNSPAYPNFHIPFSLNKLKHSIHRRVHAPPMANDFATANELVKALEMLHSEAASPALPGFGKSPMVRQLRITDSPFPLRDTEEDNHVDEAAEKFIMKFYKDLKKQNGIAYFG